MKRTLWILAVALALLASPAFAQANQQCQCTTGLCVLVADIAARSDGALPVSCTLKENGNIVSTLPVTQTNLLPTTGTAICAPPSPGPAGSTYSCAVGGVSYPAGTHSVTFTVNYATAPLAVGPSPAYSFDSVAAPSAGNASNGRVK